MGMSLVAAAAFPRAAFFCNLFKCLRLVRGRKAPWGDSRPSMRVVSMAATTIRTRGRAGNAGPKIGQSPGPAMSCKTARRAAIHRCFVGRLGLSGGILLGGGGGERGLHQAAELAPLGGRASISSRRAPASHRHPHRRGGGGGIEALGRRSMIRSRRRPCASGAGFRGRLIREDGHSNFIGGPIPTYGSTEPAVVTYRHPPAGTLSTGCRR